MRRATLFFLFAFCCCRQAHSSLENDFRFFKDIKRNSDAEAVLAAALDSEIFAIARDDLPDLRILDETVSPAPLIIRRERDVGISVVRKKAGTAVVESLREDGGSMVLVVRLDRNPADASKPAGGLTISTLLKDFERRVTVEAQEGLEWKKLVAGALIFDYTRYLELKSSEIRLPESSSIRFRLTLDKAVDEQALKIREVARSVGPAGEELSERASVETRPFRIEGIEFWREDEVEQDRGERRRPYLVKLVENTEDKAKQRTVLLVSGGRQPLCSLGIVTDSRNFSRSAFVEIPQKSEAPGENWRRLASAVISRIAFRDFQKEDLEISFPETRAEKYRIVIENRDNPQLSISAVEAKGPEYKACFMAGPGRKYRLYYGSATAPRPSADEDSLAAVLGRGFRPESAELLGQQENPAFSGETACGKWLNSRLLLGSAVFLMVLILGWGLVRSGRKLKEAGDCGGVE